MLAYLCHTFQKFACYLKIIPPPDLKGFLLLEYSLSYSLLRLQTFMSSEVLVTRLRILEIAPIFIMAC